MGAALGQEMKRRVLVIDDHLPSKTFLIKALANKGFNVVGESASGRNAAVLAKTTIPEVILMAVGLPDVDGISAAREIMEEGPLPIVLLTSHYEAENIERAKESGVMAFLIKPLREEELFPTIELAISRFAEFISLRKENEDLRRTLEARKVIERAKGILMKRQGLSEAEAFALIQKKSMDTRKSMAEMAQAIVLTEEMIKEKTA
ncbi:MAG: ANTAR domain-containing protein [Deltaproteobacteria bacterium]|nr:ANTAR domain-containing protein [Deltaproteobacteria bacterium]